MQDLFNESNSGQSAPSMLLGGGGDSTPNPHDYRYRVERFSLGGVDENDESAAMESLLTRSINPDRGVVIVDRKDSISATTGVYTCILIYMEKRVVPQEGEHNA